MTKNDWEIAEPMLATLRELDSKISSLKLALEDYYLQKQKEISPLLEQQKIIVKDLQRFCMANTSSFKDNKKKLRNGTLLIEQEEKLVIPKAVSEHLVKNLQNLDLEECLVIKYDRDALKNLKDQSLVQLGIQRVITQKLKIYFTEEICKQ